MSLEIVRDLLDQWKLAETRAREAELALHFAFLEFLQASGTEPPAEQQQQARALRSDASMKYSVAMAAVDRELDRADSLLERGAPREGTSRQRLGP